MMRTDLSASDTVKWYVCCVHEWKFCSKNGKEFLDQLNERHLLKEGFCEISDFRRGVAEAFALLAFKATLDGICLPTFRYSLSVPSSRVKAMGPETSVKKYQLELH